MSKQNQKAIEAEEKEREVSTKQKKAAPRKPFTDKLHDSWVFVQRLAAVFFAFNLLIAGYIATSKGLQSDINYMFYGLVISGSCTIAAGLVSLYGALMKVGK